MGDLTVTRDIYAGRNTIIAGELDVNGTGLNDIEGYMYIGNVGVQGGSAPGSLAIAEDFTVVGANIDSPNAALQLNTSGGSAARISNATSIRPRKSGTNTSIRRSGL